jgi:hypothetical protein
LYGQFFSCNAAFLAQDCKFVCQFFGESIFSTCSKNRPRDIFALTHCGHDCDGEEEGLWESPPHVPAVDGAVVVVVLGSVDHEGDEAAQVRVALVLKSETKILIK